MASGARGKPALQAKQRKVRVSSRELCPRLRKHILAEERNTIQAGRETQLPSNPLQEAFGSLQLPSLYYQLLCSFIVTGSCVCFLLLHQCAAKGKERNDLGAVWAGGQSPVQGTGSPAAPPACCCLLCGLRARHVPSLSALGGSTWHRALCLFTIFVLVKCLAGVLSKVAFGQDRHKPCSLLSFPRASKRVCAQLYPPRLALQLINLLALQVLPTLAGNRDVPVRETGGEKWYPEHRVHFEQSWKSVSLC